MARRERRQRRDRGVLERVCPVDRDGRDEGEGESDPDGDGGIQPSPSAKMHRMSDELELPPLPLEGWEPTKSTLHLWCQIVGKVRMASSPPRNHWWHVTLYADVRGLTTRRLRAATGGVFQIDFD